jgi:uncharacterized protein (TIGR03083 family)
MTEPPANLRRQVLHAAHRQRAPAPPAVLALLRPYAQQVAQLERLLVATLSPDDWTTPLPHHGDVTGVVTHLADNDALVAEDLGLVRDESPGPAAVATASPAQRWRHQTEVLLTELSRRDVAELDRTVRLAGRGQPQRPLRDALVQRTLETWVHANDIRQALHQPGVAPPADHVRLIVDLTVRLLPLALALTRPRAGALPADRGARLVLSGPGGGAWTFALEPGGIVRSVAVVVHAAAADLCHLVANRRSPEGFPCTVEGDAGLARDLLHAAATLACD